MIVNTSYLLELLDDDDELDELEELEELDELDDELDWEKRDFNHFFQWMD